MKTQIESRNPNLTPSRYWAEWDPDSYAPNIVRRDTRLYWHPQMAGSIGECVGTFIGENPGDAESIFGEKHPGPSPIWQKARRQSGDPTLQLILKVWEEAAKRRQKEPRATDYIEILNTYYFRNPKSGESLEAWRAARILPYFQCPSATSQFVLLGWGKDHTESEEAKALVPFLRGFKKVIIPDGNGIVRVVDGQEIPCPVVPGPAMPSGVLRRGKAQQYIANVAAVLE